MEADPHFPLVDFHCHVDLHDDPPALISECDRLGIRVLAVTTLPEAWQQNMDWTADSSFVEPALGIHPQLLKDRRPSLDLFEEYVPKARAIGEVGLDASPAHRDSLDLQSRVLDRVLELAVCHPPKLLSLHTVRAVTPVLDALEAALRGADCVPILHWFSGTPAQLRRALSLGCYFSINPRMTATKTGRSIIETIPLDRLLTESDGPFVQTQGQPVTPRSLRGTVESIADIRSTPAGDLAEQIQATAACLLATT